MDSEDRKLPEVVIDYKILKDTDAMPYGKHMGTAMVNVPAGDLLWLIDADRCSKSVREYILRNWDVLCKQAGRDPKKGIQPKQTKIDRYLRK